LHRERPKPSSGRRLVDWIYVDDVFEGLTRAAFASEIPESTFDLGFGSLVSIRHVIEHITKLIGNGVEPDFGALPDRRFEPERVADTSFMERAFEWAPRTSLEEGLGETVK
jgi:nucleoside-diphosphate-sugar epimerase